MTKFLETMNEKICRLCFEKKTRPIGIFTAKGIKLKIAAIIRKHFSDEVNIIAFPFVPVRRIVKMFGDGIDQVSEADALPKFVCSHCWTNTTKFHKFYNTVIDGKKTFLASSVGKEEPTFNEINCDSFTIDVPDIDIADIAYGKCEPIMKNEQKESTEDTPTPFYGHFDNNSSTDCDSINRDNEPQLNDLEISEKIENIVGIETVPDKYPKYDHGSIQRSWRRILYQI